MKKPLTPSFIRVLRWFAAGVVFTLGALAQPVSVEWFEAARMGDMQSLQRQLAAGAGIDQTDYSKRTALHHALSTGQFATARFLIERGASLSLDAKSRRPLNWAVQAGNLDIVRLMLDKGADPRALVETVMGTRGNVLNEAVQWGRADMLKLFETKGYSATPDFYSDLIVWAARHGEVDTARYYLAKGGNPNRAFRDNLSLDMAAFYGDMPLVEALLQAGARPGVISEGQLPGDRIEAFPRTALMTAVLANEREVVERLLKAGADPRALNNAAVVWADLTGDEEIYRMLQRGGAPNPMSFGFGEWLRAGRDYFEKAPDAARGSAAESALSEMVRLGALRDERSTGAATLPAGTKIAIVALGEGWENAAGMLGDQAASLPGVVVMDRAETRRLLTERKLIDVLGRPGGESTAGRFLGADVLVLLRSWQMEGVVLREARVVAVRAGAVLGTSYFTDPKVLGDWVAETVAHCRAGGDYMRAETGGYRLVAPPRVVAPVNTPAARELERELTLVLATRLARMPKVLLTEREAIDRLLAEQGGEGATYASSAWLLDATLETQPGAGGALKLVVSLRNGAAAPVLVEAVSIGGDAASALAEDALSKIATALGTAGSGEWKPEAEATALLAKARGYAANSLWAEAGAAAESAWALGARTEQVYRLRLQSAVARIGDMQRFILPEARKNNNYGGLAELVSLRAPLLMPTGNPRALSLNEMLDLANHALDIYEASLPGLAGASSYGGAPASHWLCGEAWDAATLPLRLAEPVSYRRTHGARLDELAGRLLALHGQAVGVARQRRNAMEVQTLTGLGLKHLAWWLPDENAFRLRVRQTLKESTLWIPPLSEHAAWGSAWRVARPLMQGSAGRAGQAWVRLAREMAASRDAREAYFGLALLGLETNSLRRRVETAQLLMERFSAISDLDRGINTRVYAPAFETFAKTPFQEHLMRPWYADAFNEMRRVNAMHTDIQMGPPTDNAFDLTGGNDRINPDIRAFYIDQSVRRLETIRRAGAGGVLHFTASQRQGYTTEQLDRLARAQEAAAVVLTQVGATAPRTVQTQAAPEANRRAAAAPTPSKPAEVRPIKTTRVTNPFLAPYSRLSPVLKAKWNAYMVCDEMRAGSRDWYLIKIIARDFPRTDPHGQVSDLVAFRLDNTGEPRDSRVIATEFTARYGQQGQMQMQMNERWMVVPGVRYQPDVPDDDWVESIAVAETGNASASARFFNLASSRYGLRSLRLVGDRVIYAFINNPTGPRMATVSTQLEQRGDPTFGVAEIDLRTGRETLLVSSRRHPVASPVETEPLRVYRRISVIGDTAFTVADGERRSEYLFDLEARQWRRLTDAEKKAAASDDGRHLGEWRITVEGESLRLQPRLQKNSLRFMGGRSVGTMLDVPIEIDHANYAGTYREWTGIVDQAARAQTGPNIISTRVYPTSDGFLIMQGNGGFCSWVPMAPVREALSQIVLTKRAEAAARAAERAANAPAPAPAAAPEAEAVPETPATDEAEGGL